MGKFQSTCASRSTTRLRHGCRAYVGVSIHVPLAEHDRDIAKFIYDRDVSIHVPLAEHDHAAHCGKSIRVKFQFTCPSRSTTKTAESAAAPLIVSIHVPLAEHDLLTEI